MKQKLTKNLDLKILAVLFSVILWLIVVNIDDPVKSVQFSDINVEILNASELKKQGKVYEVLDNTDNITVTVVGRRSVIEEMAKENISATADMKNLTSMDTISIVLSSNKNANELDSLRSSIENVKLEIEDIKKIQKPIITVVEGAPADGHMLGDLSVNLNRVNIEGPESVIDTIDSAKAILDANGVTTSIIASVPVRLYDKSGNIIDDPRVTTNITSVSVNQEILVKKEIPIQFNVTGTPAEGYALTGEVNASQKSVWIAGKKNIIDSVNAIVIPEEVLNVEGYRISLTTVIDLADYLPKSAEFADPNFDSQIEVTVGIQRETFITVSFDESTIKIINAPDAYNVSVVRDGTYFKTGENHIRLYGLSNVLSAFDDSDLVIEVDLKKYMEEKNMISLNPGNFWVTPEFKFPDGIRLIDDFRLELKAEKKP